ncbi:TetR/AcrR family transcriptional regulator [Rhodococcus sp. OK302]|uniref:TetR/AcrR family transcriptional regulator n=1 Tax=Rhodococcus sp. OK302 TaxID=1882769 RepID=UPI000B93FEA7|nr:TetR/AcrR family transcriptional regulator [Rhodococcus sp. OK302]OYD60976.1 TetR family transcriptional regulator [Rhodococcus sp. OK302]
MSNPIDVPAVSTSGTANLDQHPRAVVTREKILLESARVFDASGYSAASLSAIIATSYLTKGAVFYHFPSKEAIAQHLVQGWSLAVATAFSAAAATGESATTQLRTAFTALANSVEGDQTIRAGMKLTLDPSIEGAHESHRSWIDTTSDLVDQGIESGAIRDTAASHRLAWNLCAGFTGAVHSVEILREDLDLATRTSDMLSSYLTNATPTAHDRGLA